MKDKIISGYMGRRAEEGHVAQFPEFSENGECLFF